MFSQASLFLGPLIWHLNFFPPKELIWMKAFIFSEHKSSVWKSMYDHKRHKMLAFIHFQGGNWALERCDHSCANHRWMTLEKQLLLPSDWLPVGWCAYIEVLHIPFRTPYWFLWWSEAGWVFNRCFKKLNLIVWGKSLNKTMNQD